MPRISVVIPTYNGAAPLRRTLDTLAAQRTTASWEVVVVVNNSTDDTSEVLAEMANRLPGSLRVVTAAEQGHCAALNAGITASGGDIVVITNHDVEVHPDWLGAAAGALEFHHCDYVGGKVLPIWRAARPVWLPDKPGMHRAVLALLDYGEAPLQFDERVPLGCNMAFRRDAFTRAGLWDNRFGRRPGTLIGQDVREWGIRARRVGLIGMYAPDMIVRHVVTGDRLTKQYFRRWMYWHGVSRALLYARWGVDIERPEEHPRDLSAVPHILGVPRYLYRSKLLRPLQGWVSAHFHGDAVASFEQEMQVCFFAGLLRQRLSDRHLGPPRALRPVTGTGRTATRTVTHHPAMNGSPRTPLGTTSPSAPPLIERQPDHPGADAPR
jgi:glycosyltransferase involved in cell wall biosynthesis